MKKIKSIPVLSFCVLFFLYSCGTNHFQQRKNFHLRVQTDQVAHLPSPGPVMVKHQEPVHQTIQSGVNNLNIQGTQPELISQKNLLGSAGQKHARVNHQFQQNKILKVNKVEKTNDEGAGLAAIILGALAILFLVFGFVLVHVSASLFAAFWVAGLKLGIYGAVAGVFAVADDDDTIEVIGCILGCLAVILAFILLCIVLL